MASAHSSSFFVLMHEAAMRTRVCWTTRTSMNRSLLRDAPQRLDRGFVVRDGNYVSARWPGDAHRYTNELLAVLSG